MRFRAIHLVLLLSIAILLPATSGATSVYAHWLTVKEIRYFAGSQVYLVSFEGTTAGGDEVDAYGNPCDNLEFAVFKATGNQTAEDVSRQIQALEIARATGLLVRVWVDGCETGNGPTNFPHAYSVWTKPPSPV